MRRGDALAVGGYALALYGVSLVGGRPLSAHEARLPQTCREMYAAGEWWIPTCGGYPWLERPPLPHWLTLSVAHLFGRCDEEWIARIVPAILGAGTVLLVAWMAAHWFGRAAGIVAGLVHATAFEFARYAWLAEEEVFLAFLVTLALALFVRAESGIDPRRSFLGGRPAAVSAFFLVLVLANMVKGLFFGPFMVLVPTLGFLLWSRAWDRMRRYVWLWGSLAFLATASFWYVAVLRTHPDAARIWFSDVLVRARDSHLSEPPWYYVVAILGAAAPWTPLAIVQLVRTRRQAFREPLSPERFLWCWALLPLLLLSIPSGKHHHYLVPALGAWSILGAQAGIAYWRNLAPRGPLRPLLLVGLPGATAVWLLRGRLPADVRVQLAAAAAVPLLVLWIWWVVRRQRPAAVLAGLFLSLGALYAAGHVVAGRHFDKHRVDAEFLREARRRLPPGAEVFTLLEGEPMKVFHNLFYLPEGARLLPNATFLRSGRIRGSEVYVVSRRDVGPELAAYGEAEALLGSGRDDRRGPLTLFRVRLRADLERVPEPAVTAGQVYGVVSIPLLGEPMARIR